ncbi:hypothetical protein AB1285_27270 [Microbacterium sp. NRRL B-14842]|uniref:hypothetical protein n=1 Tax=Microbacterium sp. NRRL B-14842 TaxID=3162881 RepID=UPI003D2D76D0
MTITQTAAPTGTAVTITGTIRTPLTLVRRLPDRRARVGSASTPTPAPTTSTPTAPSPSCSD